jgi:hypothetical protein
MGGIAQTISNIVTPIFQPIEQVVAPVIKSVGTVVDGAVHAVGSAAESVGHTLQSIGQGIVNDPIGSIAKVAAVASGQWYMLPLVSAVDVVAHGGNIEQAALAAGVSLATSYIGGNITANLDVPGLDTAANQVTQDAADLAAQGIPASQISQILAQSYPEVAANITDSMANAAAAGVSASTLASAYGGAFGAGLTGVQDAFSEHLLNTAIGNSAANFAKTLVQTKGDVGKALQMGAAAGIGTELSGQISNQLVQAGADTTLASITGKIAGATASGVVQGQDVGKALGTSLVSNIISISYAQAGQAFKSAAEQSGITKIFTDMGTAAATKMNEFAASFQSAQAKAADLTTQQNSIVTDYNTKLNAASSYYKDTLTPAQTQAESLQAAASASYDAYKEQADKYGSLVSQYDAAKAAGNADLANSLADQANAIIPTLNSAADKYNADINTYQNASQSFNDIVATYKAQTDALAPLKTQVDNLNTQIAATTETSNQYATQFNDAAKTVQDQVQQVVDQKIAADQQLADQPDAVKKAFENAFSTGQMPSDALAVANNVAKLTGVSQDAFNQSFATGASVADSLKFAQDVNALPTKNQNYYDFASSMGLKPTDALSVAPQLAGASTPALQTFFDAYSSNGNNTADASKLAAQVNALSPQQQTSFTYGRNSGLDLQQSLAMANSVGTLTAAQQANYLDAVKNYGLTDQYASVYAKSSGIYETNKAGLTDSNAANLAQFTSPEAKDAYAMTMAKTGDMVQAFNAGKMLENAIAVATGSGSAQAGEIPTTGTKYTTNATWQQRGDGAWSIVGTDQQGKPITLVDLATSTSPVKEGQSAGQYTVSNDIKAEGGFTAAPATAEQAAVGPDVASKEVSPDGKTTTFTLKTGEKEVYDNATGNLVSTTPASSTTPLTSDQLLQNYMDQLMGPTGATGPTTGVTGTTAPVGTTGVATGPTTGVTGTISPVTGTTGPTADATPSTIGGVTGSITGTTGPTTGVTGGTGTADTTTPGVTGGTGASQSDLLAAMENAKLQKLMQDQAAAQAARDAAAQQAAAQQAAAAQKAAADQAAAQQAAIKEAAAQQAAAIAAQTAAQQAAAAKAAGVVQRQNAVNYMQQGASGTSGTDTTGGIKNLTGNVTKASQDYTLSGVPTIQESMNPLEQIPHFAAGSNVTGATAYDPFAAGSSGDSVNTGLSSSLKPSLTKAQIQYILTGLPSNLLEHKAAGGEIGEHNPEFFSEGGLGAINHRYVKGDGDGTSDSVPAMLANGEFVIPADVVAKLGNGSNEAGAGVLDQFLKTIRTHAASNGTKLPPDSKGPLAYLLDAKRKVKA